MRKLATVSVLIISIAAAVLVVLLAAAVHTYHRLSEETIIAELRFDRTGDREYVAYLRTGNRCEERMFPIVGDQWRIDAEFLKWKYWALLLGLDAQYRLERLEGRYRSARDQNGEPSSTHDLVPTTAIDIVDFAAALGPLNFLLDAVHDTSTYQNIDTRRVYYVSKTPSGIVTRSVPRPVVQPSSEALAIAIERGCGTPPGLWPRVAAWTDEMVTSALAVFN